MPISPQQRIAELEAEVAALRAEMQDFTYTVSHDLRAPLRHILSYVDLVQEDAGHLLDAETQGFLRTISDSARHMGLLMEGLAELSRVGSAPLVLADVPLLPLVQDVMTELSAAQPERRIEWHLPLQLPAAYADAALLRKALWQLLDNAVKFSGKRPVALVAISAAAASDPEQRVVLRIQDQGAGFNPALQGQLFKPFGRLHSSQQFAGIGIGLALVRKITDRLRGQIELAAEVDQGCLATIRLPAARGSG